MAGLAIREAYLIAQENILFFRFMTIMNNVGFHTSIRVAKQRHACKRQHSKQHCVKDIWEQEAK